MRNSGWTREEGEALVESLVGPVRTIPFKYGWVAVASLTEEDRRPERHLGMGTYVIDQEARVITAHSSVASSIIAKEYTRARRQGLITGRRIWPTQA